MACNKKRSVEQIFADMDYENVIENDDLALAWLGKHNYEFCTISGEEMKPEVIELFTQKKTVINVPYAKNTQFKTLIKKSEAQLKTWLKVSPMEKAKLLNRLAAEIERHSTLLCQLEMICHNILTKTKSYRLLTDFLRYYAGWASLVDKEFADYKPYGVCTISMENTSSIGALGTMLAPALAAGNTVILSVDFRFAPIATLIQELCKNVGFPDDVVIVTVTRSALYEESYGKVALLQHMWSAKGIERKVWNGTNVTMLHIGRSSMIVFDNADLDSACDKVFESAWPNEGMFPWGVDKLFVQETIFDEFLARFMAKIEKLHVGKDARQKILDIVVPEDMHSLPSEVTLCNKLPVVVGNKLFGSNVIHWEKPHAALSILPFRTASEAASLANNGRYGFAASVWTENIGLANEMTAKLKMGIVWVNTHGYINSTAPFRLYKDSGTGYLGGPEGLLEFLTYNKVNDFIPVELKETDIQGRLPCAMEKKRTYLYYGGAFKQSESGLTESDAEFPNKKDIRNCVEAAKKGYENWNKRPAKVRGQTLWKLAECSASIKVANVPVVNKWTEHLYEWSTLCNSTESLVQCGAPALRVIKEAVGVLGIELHTDTRHSLLALIVAALAFGNAVIILDFSQDMQEFLTELSKVVVAAGLPAGVFNVIFNPNAGVVHHLHTHRELQAYFRLDRKTPLTHPRAKNYNNVNFQSRKHIVSLVTNSKCVWTSVGESFL